MLFIRLDIHPTEHRASFRGEGVFWVFFILKLIRRGKIWRSNVAPSPNILFFWAWQSEQLRVYFRITSSSILIWHFPCQSWAWALKRRSGGVFLSLVKCHAIYEKASFQCVLNISKFVRTHNFGPYMNEFEHNIIMCSFFNNIQAIFWGNIVYMYIVYNTYYKDELSILSVYIFIYLHTLSVYQSIVLSLYTYMLELLQVRGSFLQLKWQFFIYFSYQKLLVIYPYGIHTVY